MNLQKPAPKKDLSNPSVLTPFIILKAKQKAAGVNRGAAGKWGAAGMSYQSF